MNNDIKTLFGLGAAPVGRPIAGIPKLDSPLPDLLYGIELEIEYAGDFQRSYNMTTTEDGSLRNEGYEFITLPMNYSETMFVLEDFFNRNKAYFNGENYSERTSVHVHVNCLDLVPEQLASVLLLYQVFENVLFKFIGYDRNKNIFCVPLSECAVTYQAAEQIANNNFRSIDKWMKYTALNFLPLKTQGTIEFRHMHGTNDVALIGLWLRLIGSIMRYAKEYSYTEIKDRLSKLNTNSQYRNILQHVFGADSGTITYPDTNEMIENGVLNMKYSLLQPVKVSSKYSTASLGQILQGMQAQVAQGVGPAYWNDNVFVAQGQQVNWAPIIDDEPVERYEPEPEPF